MPASRKRSPSSSDSTAAEVSTGYASNMDGVAAVERALAIVEALEAAQRPLTLTQLSTTTGLYKSAVLRLMVSLERHSLVVRRHDQSYVLGTLAFRLGRAFESTHRLDEHLMPVMRKLVTQGAESPSFHVYQDDKTRLCLLRIDSNHSTLDRVRVGDRLPLQRGAPGKVILKFEAGLPPDTRATADDLREVSHGERDPSCGAIAAPVFGAGNELIGALSLSGPLERFTPTAIRKMDAWLLEACETASISLGGPWPVRHGGTRTRAATR
jgi:DNA-binding IclR family transcriptional regulator